MTGMHGRGRLPARPPQDKRDVGAAMLVAVMVITVVAILSTSIAVMATRSVRTAGDAATAGVVKDLANAGLASGVTYLRQASIDPAAPNPFPSTGPACGSVTVDSTKPLWTQANPAEIDGGPKGDYSVWMERVQAANGTNPAVYRVCSEGTSGKGARTASVEATYTPAGGAAGPYAVYGKGDINLQSSAQVISNMSVYSEECIDRKGNAQTIGGTDLASGLPAAAHARSWVLDGSGPDACEASRSVHNGSDFVDGVEGGGDQAYPYDTDNSGGPVANDPENDGAGHPDLTDPDEPWNGTTLEDSGQTVEQFRARWRLPDMLGTESINALETRAKQQGNYYSLTSANLSPVQTPDESHAVLFLNFQTHVSVNLAAPEVDFLSPWDTASCLPGKSLIIVFRNADVEGNGNRHVRASVVVKNGGFTKLNGGFDLIGGLFAENGLDLSGNGTVRLDPCAVQNPPPGGTPKVDVSKYVEYDRS